MENNNHTDKDKDDLDWETPKEEFIKIESISDYPQEQIGNLYDYNYLYGYKDACRHLPTLITDLGEKKLYDSLSQCNRCGYCETVCPTYMLTGRESISARGRNQIIKMVMTGKIKNRENARESVFTCLLCGACQSVCYAKVQTPEHVLEARRGIKNYSDNLGVKFGMKILLKKPQFLALWIKLGFLMKKIGLAFLAGKLGIYTILGMPQAKEAQEAIDNPPLKFLTDYLQKDPDLNSETGVEESKPAWAYFAPCGPNYIYPEVGLSTISILKRFLGKGIFLNNFCCGLIAYNYGKLEDAKKFAEKNIILFEKYKKKFGDFIIVGDCSSCVAFMKTYEQLFTNDKEWRLRAKEFAQNIKDILELAAKFRVKEISAEKLQELQLGKVTYHDSCRACHGQNIRQEPRDILKKLIGDKFVELNESDWCCGGAGAFAFTQKQLSEKILHRKIKNIACAQAETVIAGATSCLIQINTGLKKHYPTAKVEHFSVFIDRLTK
ncbi:MAG: (Fe-S)-binding protein [Elusimicrobia bacterium]|nr:(Fe-S)-binding protein [Elusimicrobiota bacterium]